MMHAEILNFNMHNVLFAVYVPLIYFVMTFAISISYCTQSGNHNPNTVTVDGKSGDIQYLI